jgi:hypothetical protein
MPQKSEERRLAPAPSESSASFRWKPLSTSASKVQEDFTPRFGFRSYPERSHQHARQERDRRLGKDTINKPLIDLDDVSDGKHVCDRACGRLSDHQWFSIHPLARSRLRNSLVGEEGSRVLVTLKGKRTIERIYFGGEHHE